MWLTLKNLHDGRFNVITNFKTTLVPYQWFRILLRHMRQNIWDGSNPSILRPQISSAFLQEFPPSERVSNINSSWSCAIHILTICAFVFRISCLWISNSEAWWFGLSGPWQIERALLHLPPVRTYWLFQHDTRRWKSGAMPLCMFRYLLDVRMKVSCTWAPDARSIAASPQAVPTATVCTGGLMYCIVS